MDDRATELAVSTRTMRFLATAAVLLLVAAGTAAAGGPGDGTVCLHTPLGYGCL